MLHKMTMESKGRSERDRPAPLRWTLDGAPSHSGRLSGIPENRPRSDLELRLSA